jgi:sialate O-acetylesterase
MIETWISREAFENSDEFKSMISQMKVLNLDSLTKQRMESTNKKIKTLQGGLPTAAEAITWKNTSLDDKGWPTMQLPGLWESKQLGELDGIAWFRKTIDIAAADAGKEAILELAKIDDNDITYVNEVRAGSTNSYSTNRKYTIPAGILKEGKNIIAIRVEDTGGGGGVYGESSDMKLTIGNTVISLAGPWAFKVESLLKSSSGTVGPNDYPTLLYNAMLHPLIPYAIKGAIWYQGETNAGRAYQYRKAFPLMITDWRTKWKQGDFPFYFVQLASFGASNGNSKTGSAWAELREAQGLTLSLPNTGIAITTDIGEEKDIHPKNKQDVGKRLAAIALHKSYGINNIYNGPKYQSMKIEGNKVIVSFNKIGGELFVKDLSGEIKGFEIAGADKQFYNAKGIIKGNTVVLSYDEVVKPVAVRYAWADYPGDANLFNKQGFPAGPFRTDKWKGITEANKYAIVK